MVVLTTRLCHRGQRAGPPPASDLICLLPHSLLPSQALLSCALMKCSASSAAMQPAGHREQISLVTGTC